MPPGTQVQICGHFYVATHVQPVCLESDPLLGPPGPAYQRHSRFSGLARLCQSGVRQLFGDWSPCSVPGKVMLRRSAGTASTEELATTD